MEVEEREEEPETFDWSKFDDRIPEEQTQDNYKFDFSSP